MFRCSDATSGYTAVCFYCDFRTIHHGRDRKMIVGLDCRRELDRSWCPRTFRAPVSRLSRKALPPPRWRAPHSSHGPVRPSRLQNVRAACESRGLPSSSGRIAGVRQMRDHKPSIGGLSGSSREPKSSEAICSAAKTRSVCSPMVATAIETTDQVKPSERWTFWKDTAIAAVDGTRLDAASPFSARRAVTSLTSGVLADTASGPVFCRRPARRIAQDGDDGVCLMILREGDGIRATRSKRRPR